MPRPYTFEQTVILERRKKTTLSRLARSATRATGRVHTDESFRTECWVQSPCQFNLDQGFRTRPVASIVNLT